MHTILVRNPHFTFLHSFQLPQKKNNSRINTVTCNAKRWNDSSNVCRVSLSLNPGTPGMFVVLTVHKDLLTAAHCPTQATWGKCLLEFVSIKQWHPSLLPSPRYSKVVL